MRNKFVHNVTSSNDNLKSYLNTLSPKRKKECKKTLNSIKTIEFEGKIKSGADFFNDNPRVAIQSTGMTILHYMRQITIGGQQNRRFIKELVKSYEKNNKPFVIKANEHKLEKLITPLLTSQR